MIQEMCQVVANISIPNKGYIMKAKLLITALIASVALSSAQADEGKSLYGKCIGCHGLNGEKKAMNVSKIINEMPQEEIAKSLRGYKTGTYGGNMKGVMRAQVASYSDAQIDDVAAYIATLK